MLTVLLSEQRHSECLETAEQFLTKPDLPDVERAQAYLALSLSRAKLLHIQEAITPGELAAYFSRQSGAYDLLGRALCHLAVLYHETRLNQRAVGCLEQYFQFFTLYTRAKELEGWVLAYLGQCYQAEGRHPKALEYLGKAYRWHWYQVSSPQSLDEHRAEFIWQALQLGQVDEARPLLADSECYLCQAPNDLEARARYWNNVSYLHYLTYDYSAATKHALSVVHMSNIPALRRAQGCLTLHHIAKAMGRHKEALGWGALVRVQAHLARRPDLADEVTRSILHMQQVDGVPSIDELADAASQWTRRAPVALQASS